MAIITVTSTADSGSGSLRQALSGAASGDTIVFDNSLEVDGVITIELSSVLQMPARNVYIDGGEHWTENDDLKTRVIIDAQELSRCIAGVSGTHWFNLKNLTFLNGKIAGASSYGGGVVTNSSTTQNNIVDYCVFKNCSAINGGGIGLQASSAATINNCLFDTCVSSSRGAVALYYDNKTTITNCIFKNCTASSGASVYVHQLGTATIENCTFGDTTSTQNVLISGTAEIKNVVVDKMQFNSASVITISETITATILTVTSGASITFSGVDSILAVTTTATIGSSTFTAAEGATGYAAFPSGTDISAATFTGVKTATYGSVTSINATIDANVATFTITAASTGYLIEGSTDGVTWETITPTEGKATLTSAKAYQFRTFAGAFVYSPVIPRTYYYTGGTADGDFSVAADWALDKDKSIVCSDAPTIKDGVFYCVEVE